MRAPLNLARRPFRNERLPTIALALACAALALLTARHVLAARDLLPGRARDVEGEAVRLERELFELRAEAQGLGGQAAAPTAALAEWAAVKELVDRRAFSWTGLFAELETTLPPGVRLEGVAPVAGKGGLALSLTAVGRRVEDALALLEALQGNPRFADALLSGYSEADTGVRITCTVAYRPEGKRPATAGGGGP